MVADCRVLPVARGSADIAVVQGGLHHLSSLPRDLSAVLSEVSRALRPSGLFVVVEPWSTPFLWFVHALCRIPLVRGALPKLDALATMIEHERETYERWLRNGRVVMTELTRYFEPQQVHTRWGKLHFVGKPRVA
jgi:ubiquinone/menaquinone biosynthesis C-methylase UbiE